MAYRVSKPEFERLVGLALAEIPADFAEKLIEVQIEIRDRPTRAELQSAGIDPDDGEGLLGLYVGIPLTERHVEADLSPSPVVYLYQRELELAAHDVDSLIREVRTTVLHEVGHHFGLDEDDLERLGYG